MLQLITRKKGAVGGEGTMQIRRKHKALHARKSLLLKAESNVQANEKQKYVCELI